MRKISQVLGTIGLLLPTMAFAVGLGSINVHSSLNQQLNAQVPIVDVGNVALDSVQVTLASPDQFKLVGLERDPNLSLLRFNVLRATNGQAYVQISSTEPIASPIVTFLVNLTWPNGQMMREYTVFLDPVSYTHTTIAQLQPATADSTSEQQEQEASQASSLETKTYGPTTSDDDLWEIAKKTRLPNTSIQQNMVAIFKKNQRAFSNDNINGLRAGFILNLPTLQQVNTMSTADAIDYLKQQDKASHEQPQQPVQTLPEPLTASSTSQTQVNTKPEEIQLLPENELMKEGDQFKSSATTKALGSESITQQQQKSAMTKQLVDMQKQIIAKDRQILTLEKMLEENQQQGQQQGQQQVQSGQQATPSMTSTQQQTQSAAQAGEVKISYGLPWYTFPLLLFIILISLIAGVFLQRYRMKLGFGSDLSRRVEIPKIIKKVLRRSEPENDEPSTDHFEAIAKNIVDESDREKDDALPEPDENVSGKFDLMSTLPEIEKLIGQKEYQQAISQLQKLREQNGNQFDINIKLLELYGLSQQKNKFKQYYQELASLGLSATEQNLLDAIASMFPGFQQQNEVEQEDFDDVVKDERPETFSIETIQPESEQEQEPEQESEVEKQDAILEMPSETQETSDKEQDTEQDIETEKESAHVIEFEAGLGESIKKEAEPEQQPEEVDEQAWQNMVDNLSIEPKEDSSKEGESDTIAAPESEPEMEPEAEPEQEEPVQKEDFETQLNLATAYIEMGDTQEAKEILEHVIANGNEQEQQAAKNLLAQIK